MKKIKLMFVDQLAGEQMKIENETPVRKKNALVRVKLVLTQAKTKKSEREGMGWSDLGKLVI